MFHTCISFPSEKALFSSYQFEKFQLSHKNLFWVKCRFLTHTQISQQFTEQIQFYQKFSVKWRLSFQATPVSTQSTIFPEQLFVFRFNRVQTSWLFTQPPVCKPSQINWSGRVKCKEFNSCYLISIVHNPPKLRHFHRVCSVSTESPVCASTDCIDRLHKSSRISSFFKLSWFESIIKHFNKYVIEPKFHTCILYFFPFGKALFQAINWKVSTFLQEYFPESSSHSCFRLELTIPDHNSFRNEFHF